MGHNLIRRGMTLLSLKNSAVNLRKMLKNISPYKCEIMFNDVLNALMGKHEVNMCEKV